MKEMLYKFIDEGRREHEEMRAFIREFKTTNKLLLKERNNSLSELKFEVYGLSNAINNAQLPNYKVKGMTTRGGKTTTKIVRDTNDINKEPSVKERKRKSLTMKVLRKSETTSHKHAIHRCPFLNAKVRLIFEGTTIKKPDLRVSISLMPYTMYEKLGLGEPKPIRMSLELEDRSIKYPQGIVENVLIKTDKFILPIDFVILDMQEDFRISIILGRPFIATARAMIDVFNKKITIRVGNKEELLEDDQLDSFLVTNLEKSIDQSDLESCVRMMMALSPKHLYGVSNKLICHIQSHMKQRGPKKSKTETSISLAPMKLTKKRPELKDLPSHLEYAYLKGNESCPVIISSKLTEKEKVSLLQEGIVLGHKISRKGIKVDKAKIDVIAKLPYPTNVKGVRSFLGYAGFYRRFIKDFFMISKPMTQLLMKDAKFEFSKDLGVVLGQRIDGKFKPIYYASKTLNDAQAHYTTTEKELLAVVFSFDKFHPYIILSKTIVYTDHSALKYLFSKQDAKPRLIRWILLLQGFNIKIKDKKEAENLTADHLSRLENSNMGELAEEKIADKFPDEYFDDIKDTEKEKMVLLSGEELFWDEPYGFRLCSDNVMRRCVAGDEILEILTHCHSSPTRGHHSASATWRKVYKTGF
uniref:RNA-directed DNA polymerase n=1 Tax=Tanacetum cinerariifolium TaxID=118510 RepID=A0A699H2Q4_TANCI|nr:reverse transcriptase domain-containing protein [Tanacetum cinerariifolium]